MKLILPFPPSVNTYWRHPNKGAFAGKSLISAAGRKFQSAACAAIVEQLRRLPKPTSAPASVEIVLFPPDKRLTPYQCEMLGRVDGKQVAHQPQIANLVYGDRMGNNSQGDGWKYRGRGLLQITGRENYTKCGTALNLDLISTPELLTQERHAARSAAWYFTLRGCLLYSGDVERVTQIINGGQNGIKDRRERYAKAKTALV